MRSKSDGSDPHADWSRLGKKSRRQINAEAAEEKAKLGLVGSNKHLTAHVNGKRYEVEVPDVRAIREKLGLTQETFAGRFHLREIAPDVIARAACAIGRDLDG